MIRQIAELEENLYRTSIGLKGFNVSIVAHVCWTFESNYSRIERNTEHLLVSKLSSLNRTMIGLCQIDIGPERYDPMR